MSSEVAIQARDLGKAYRLYRHPSDRFKQALAGKGRQFYEEFWALQHIDLTVRKGETLGIIGRNGAGKSTLLQLICGTLKPSTGAVTAAGRVAAMLELGAGFNGEFTGRENVLTSAALFGLGPAAIRARMPAIEAFAGIGDFIDVPVKRYSSGMYARLAFAVSAHVDADILVVDEILGVGDFEFQQKCMRFMRDFRRRGTLLFVSHDDAAVARLCDNALLLHHGAAREYGDAREICRRYRVLQSEQMSDGSGSFRSEGVLKPLPPPAPPALAFDPDAPDAPSGGGEIGAVGIHAPDGAPLAGAAGGEMVELRVGFKAARAIAKPIVVFTLRDRLAQILFGDDTRAGAAPALEAGQRAEASFRFQLPYLASGAFALEIFLFDGDVLLDHRQEAAVLRIQSRHVSGGLANLAMDEVSMAVDAPAGG
jgi:lipopolysaccharide transport system ATP-binding protein